MPPRDGTAPQPFPPHFAIVEENRKFKLIDTTGKSITAFFDDVERFSQGLAPVRNEGKSGFIDLEGKVKTPLQYDFVNYFKDDYAIVEKKGRYGLLDTLGHESLPCQYTAIYPTGHHIYLTEQNGNFGLFAPDHGVRLEPAYEQIGYLKEENTWIRAKKGGKWGWVDADGQVKIPFRYDAVAPLKNGKAVVQQEPYPNFFHINMAGEMTLIALPK
jgi:hypothetical protein